MAFDCVLSGMNIYLLVGSFVVKLDFGISILPEESHSRLAAAIRSIKVRR